MSLLGQRLRQAREERGLALLQVEIDTRIRSAVLQALENGDLDNLPPEPFLRGLIRSYANYLHLDPKEVLELYAADVSPTPLPSAPVFPRRPVAAPHKPAERPPQIEPAPEPPAFPEEPPAPPPQPEIESAPLPFPFDDTAPPPPSYPFPSVTFVPEPPPPISSKRKRSKSPFPLFGWHLPISLFRPSGPGLSPQASTNQSSDPSSPQPAPPSLSWDSVDSTLPTRTFPGAPPIPESTRPEPTPPTFVRTPAPPSEPSTAPELIADQTPTEVPEKAAPLPTAGTIVPPEVALDFKEIAPILRVRASGRPVPLPAIILLGVSFVAACIAVALVGYAWSNSIYSSSAALAQVTPTRTRAVPTITPTTVPGARPTSIPTLAITAGPVSTFVPVVTPAATQPTQPSQPTQPTQPPSQTKQAVLNLKISATQPITIQVGVDGLVAFSGAMPAGTSQSWTATRVLYLRIEHPLDASMELNGNGRWFAPMNFNERTMMIRQWTLNSIGNPLPVTPTLPRPGTPAPGVVATPVSNLIGTPPSPSSVTPASPPIRTSEATPTGTLLTTATSAITNPLASVSPTPTLTPFF